MFKKDSLQIIAFHSYGTDSQFYLKGRALEDENINLENKTWLGLLINSWKRLGVDEVKNTELEIKLPHGVLLKTTTDDKGYFKVRANLSGLKGLTNSEGWLPCEVAYSDVSVKRHIKNENRFPAEILIPSSEAKFGVASDIDDTILHTGVVSFLKWRLIINTIFKSAYTRLPLEGASEFYHKLHRGASGKEANPIFYVSHSPWNLYRYLKLFLKQNDFPKGPILLRSLDSLFKKKSIDEKPQKQKEIINLLTMYPDLPFILIGDSGEHDPDIYIEVAEKFPNRILAIYLRSVNHKKRMQRVKGIVASYKSTPILLVESSKEAIEHARSIGFIK